MLRAPNPLAYGKRLLEERFGLRVAALLIIAAGEVIESHCVFPVLLAVTRFHLLKITFRQWSCFGIFPGRSKFDRGLVQDLRAVWRCGQRLLHAAKVRMIEP